MIQRHAIISATFLAILSAASICRSQEDQDTGPSNYLVVWNDGDVSEGGDSSSTRVFGNDVRFEGRPMFSGERKFARILHNTGRKTAWIGPFVQMTNGDIFPGAVAQGPAEFRSTELERQQWERQTRERYGREPTEHEREGWERWDRERRERERKAPPLATIDATVDIRPNIYEPRARVRTDSIARITFIKNPRRILSPGLVVYRDGTEVLAKRIEWETDGVHLLLPSGVARASWEELAEVHFLSGQTAGTTDPAARQQATQEPRLLCRLVTSNGAILTYPLDTCRMSVWRGCHAVKPAWAAESLDVYPKVMVSHSFFRENEIALSSLPARTLSEKNITGYLWKWKRNQNVRGEQLASGTMVTDLGIGMHSHCEVAFELPDNSLKFTAWVGIDEAVGDGGCVRCKVFRDEVSGEPAWSSGLLRGVDAPVPVTVEDLRGAKRLILVAEFADEDHPPDADPFDLRDEVAWLFPFVTVSET